MRIRIASTCALAALALGAPARAAENGLGQKPYMGWSSWSLQATKYPGYGGQAWLTSAHVKEQSDAMAARLQKHGYRYINMDSGWRGGWDEWGRPTAHAERFPQGIREVADHVHARGQKFGIYYVPGIDDDLLALNPPVKGTGKRIADIVFVPRRVANAWGGGHAIDFAKPGAREYIQSIADLFASWQVDFLKFDSVTPGSEHLDLKIDSRADVAAWGRVLIQTKRPIWLTVSWKIDLRYNDFWRRHANALRVTQDVESYDDKLTHWSPQVLRHFDAARLYSRLSGPGRGWNDMDSLLVGNGEMSGLSSDERRSVMTLWAISGSPLYSGDDLTKLDALGVELLTNDEVLAVQQAGVVAHHVRGDIDAGQLWAARNAAGDMIVALFNLSEKPMNVAATWDELGLSGSARVRDLWARRELGVARGKFEAAIGAHGCRLLRVSAAGGRR